MWNPLKKKSEEKPGIHLDYASTTPVAPEVLQAMLPYFSEEWANASAIYKSGVRARQVIETARGDIATLLRIRKAGVIFTSGGTESNNQALIGLVEALRKEGRSYGDMEIVTTPIEHASILETCEALKEKGVGILTVPVDEEGKILEKEFAATLSSKTVLVTFAYVNSEVGVIQDVKRLTRLVRLFNDKEGTSILIHLDAAQAPLWLPCEMDMLGVDLMSLDAGKCYGPKGVGVLALRHGVKMVPILYGGGQEGGQRSGTENTALIVGCSKALARAMKGYAERSDRALTLRDQMFQMIQKEIPTAVVNGSMTDRVANNVHISIPTIDSEYAVITLDAHGVAAGTKSACASQSSSGSYVVRAITNDEARATSTIRFTIGEATTLSDLTHAVKILKDHVIKMTAFTTKLEGKG